MRRDDVDLFVVPESQTDIHTRLMNWAMWVKPGYGSTVHPMWRHAQSNARQWHYPEFRPSCDTLDAAMVEKEIRKLPEKHGYSLRWWYVYQYPEQRIRREMGLTKEALQRIVIDARTMLRNRCVSRADL